MTYADIFQAHRAAQRQQETFARHLPRFIDNPAMIASTKANIRGQISAVRMTAEAIAAHYRAQVAA